MADSTSSSARERRRDPASAPRGVTPITILAVLADDASRNQVEIAAAELGDRLLLARTVSQAIELATHEEVHLALVDVGVDNGTGLALVHHVPALSPGARVVVVASRADIARGADAIAVGAESLHVLPLTGDTVAGAIGSARERILETRERRSLAVELGVERRRRELRDRVLRRAQRGEHHEAMRALVEGLVEQGAVRGAALYQEVASVEDEPRQKRAAAAGSLLNLPHETHDLLELGRDASLFIWSLPFAGEDLGALVADEPADERVVTGIIELASLVLALSVKDARTAGVAVETYDQGRLYAPAYLHVLAPRQIERARRHGRRLSLVLVSGASLRAFAPALLSMLRSSDVLVETHADELVLLLPETGAFGAHACRKRLFARALGDPRARPVPSMRTSTTDVGLGLGVATFPHDGEDLAVLLRVAMDRAQADVTSVVHAKDLATKPLAELVDSLVSTPITYSGSRSTYPLDLTLSALASLVEHVCREAKRGGHATFLATEHPGRGLGGVARSLIPSPSIEPPRREGGMPERRSRAAAKPTVEIRDVRQLPGCADVLAIVVRGEHGTWVTCGRIERDRYVGVHASDPLLADLVSDRLASGHKPSGEESSR